MSRMLCRERVYYRLKEAHITNSFCSGVLSYELQMSLGSAIQLKPFGNDGLTMTLLELIKVITLYQSESSWNRAKKNTKTPLHMK